MIRIIFQYGTVMLAVIVLCCVGCVKLKHKVWKWTLGMIGGSLAVLFCLCMMVVYIMNWRVVDVDTDISADGTYEVTLQQI